MIEAMPCRASAAAVRRRSDIPPVTSVPAAPFTLRARRTAAAADSCGMDVPS
jgi:hypothetical protein